MIINSYNPEFGYELISVLPYAYWLYKQKLLKETISAVDTECLYYFSPKHTINPEKRSWYNGNTTAIIKMTRDGIPNSFIHKKMIDTDRFLPPPYKTAYKNDWARFDRPILVVYNRYNNEWPANPDLNKPVNFFSLEFLDSVFKKYSEKFQVLYFNVEGTPELYDNAPPIHLEDIGLCKKYGVLHIIDLKEKHPGLTYNQLQMYYFSNCGRFLTMNGGGGILASYFGGINVIYSKYSKELEFGDFEYYHLFGGSDIKVCKSYPEVEKELEKL